MEFARVSGVIHQATREQVQGTGQRGLSITLLVEDLGVTPTIAAESTIDGVKVLFDTGDWFCLRLSGTENVARLYVEAADGQTLNVLHAVGKGLPNVSPNKELAS